jgi:tRNA (Thr-GGU) A37 N-methylase
VVELVSVNGRMLAVRGLDCRDGTPLLDLKPYYASTDCRPEARVERRSAEG